MRKELLRVEHIYKAYDNMPILNDFNLHVFEGEVLGVMGHSREEKEILANILAGFDSIDSGRIFYQDAKVSSAQLKSTFSGIYYASNQSHLFTNMTIADNFYLTSVSNDPIFCKKKVKASAQACLNELDIGVDADMPARLLSLAEQRLVQIAMAYYMGAHLIIIGEILEEPLSSPRYRNRFLNIMGKLKQKGISFIFLTPSANDAVCFSDRLVLLKNGTDIKTLDKSQFHLNQICNIMLGAFFYEENSNFKHQYNPGQTFTLNCTSTKADEPFSITAYKGEVVGIIDDDNLFISELSKLPSLPSPLISITGFFDDSPFTFSTLYDALAMKIGFIFGGTTHNSIFYNMDAEFNITVELREKSKKIGSPFIDHRKIKTILNDYDLESFCDRDILPSRRYTLSALDRQRILLYRWLIFRPRVLICINPYSHFQPELIRLVNHYFDRMASAGTTILILHNYLPIVTALYDRLVYVSPSRLESTMCRDELTDPFAFISKIRY